jgi:hypothetical protein
VDAYELARSRNPELRAFVRPKERGREIKVEEPQTRDLAALEQVSRDGGEDVRKGRPRVGEGP